MPPIDRGTGAIANFAESIRVSVNANTCRSTGAVTAQSPMSWTSVLGSYRGFDLRSGETDVVSSAGPSPWHCFSGFGEQFAGESSGAATRFTGRARAAPSPGQNQRRTRPER